MSIFTEPSTSISPKATVRSDESCRPLSEDGQGNPGGQGQPIEELGWTREEAAEVRARLSSFEQGWDAPGMEAYDDL